jgi:hypothetical protein
MKLDSDNKERNELLIEVRCMYYYEMLVWDWLRLGQ